jgi:hypothetical protein
MTAASSCDHEERTRVTCHLPINNAAEEKAFKEIITHLDRLRRQKIGVDGYTYSDPSAFYGRWWNVGTPGIGWVSDRITLLMVDFKIDLTNTRISLAETVGDLKNTVHQAYAKYGRPQEEIWVVAHKVARYA